MAVLNKLRNSTWVLILVLASLVLFVVSDYFSSNSKFGLGGAQNVGSIAGHDITYIEFDAKYKELMNQLTAGGNPETEDTRSQASNFAWNQFVQALIIDKEFDKLGIDISQQESAELLYTDNAHSTIKQYFTRDGEFSPSNVLNFYNQMAKKDPKMMDQWVLICKQVFMEVKSRKYNSLISKSLYATALDAEDDYYASALNLKGKSVNLNYATIEDKTIKIEDAELAEYIKKHKEDFQQKASRNLEYILINVSPSQADSAAIKNELASDIPGFVAAEDDSIYVLLNSSEPYSGLYQSRGSYRKEFESQLFATPKDSVIGPLYYEGGYSLYKILDKKTDSVFYFHAIKADLPIKGVTKKDTLDAIAAGKKLGAESSGASNLMDFFNQKTSTGEITYVQDLDWMREGTHTSKEINDAVKTLSYGQSTVVKSAYGLSIIKLIEPKSSELIQVAEVRKKVEPLKATEDAAYQKASNFRAGLIGEKDNEFEEQTKKFGIAKSIANNVKESDRMMTAIPGTIEVVRWAYGEDRKVGDYSDVISAGDLLIVAHLVKIKKEGTAEVDDVREDVTRLVMNEKKAVILKKQLEDAAKNAKSMEEIAIAVKSIAQPFENLNFLATGVQFAGNDVKLVGFVCGLKYNQVSRPIVSNSGVHLFYVEKPEMPELPKDLDARKKMMFDQEKQKVYNSVFESLKKAAKVTDERYKFY